MLPGKLLGLSRGLFGAFLAPLGGLLGSSWLGGSWLLLAPLRAFLGAFWDPLGRFWGASGSFLCLSLGLFPLLRRNVHFPRISFGHGVILSVLGRSHEPFGTLLKLLFFL